MAERSRWGLARRGAEDEHELLVDDVGGGGVGLTEEIEHRVRRLRRGLGGAGSRALRVRAVGDGGGGVVAAHAIEK